MAASRARSIRLAWSIVVPLWIGSSSAIAKADAAPVAIEKNTESLKRIMSYHVRFAGSSSATVKGKMVSPPEKDSQIEIWKQGLRRKQLQRMFRISGPPGTEPIKGVNGRVVQSSVGDRESRLLTGWDPEHPAKLPLEFGRNSNEFDSISGQILPSNPVNDATRLEATSFLWQVAPGFSLEDAAKVADIAEIDQPGRSIMRLQIKSSADPKLSPFVGTLIDVDPEHGYMICRIERSHDDRREVSEVLRFQETEPGLWMPVKGQVAMTMSSADSVRKSEWEMDICEINVPLDAEALTVSFPEGAQVLDAPEGKVHIWGKDGPLQTFTTDKSLREYVYERARQYQAEGRATGGVEQGRPGAGTGLGRSGTIVLVVNVVGIAVIGVLTYLRRRFKRKSATSANSPPPGISR